MHMVLLQGLRNRVQSFNFHGMAGPVRLGRWQSELSSCYCSGGAVTQLSALRHRDENWLELGDLSSSSPFTSSGMPRAANKQFVVLVTLLLLSDK